MLLNTVGGTEGQVGETGLNDEQTLSKRAGLECSPQNLWQDEPEGYM